MINAIANIIKGPRNFPTANLLMNLQNLEVVNISGTNYFKDFGPLGLNALALTTTTVNDSIALSLDSRLQTATNNAGCFAQFYNGTYPNATSAKTVLLSDLSQLYLDNYIFSNVTNKIFLIYSSEVTGSALNVILDRVEARVMKINGWGPAILYGSSASIFAYKVSNSNIVATLPANSISQHSSITNYNLLNKSTESYGDLICPTSTGPFINGVMCPNGHLVCFPYNETKICDIDLVNKSIVKYGDFSASAQGRFAEVSTGTNNILLPDGDVIVLPRTPNAITKYNYLTNQVTTFGTLTSGTDKFAGLVYISDSLLVGIPYSYNKVVNINPINNTIEEYGSIGTAATKFANYFKINDNLICCIPRNAAYVVNIHPLDATVETYGTFTGTNVYFNGAILLPNGHILALPYSGTQVLDIDPINKVTTLWGNLGVTTGKYASNTLLLQNGHILAFPNAANYLIDIDPVNQSIENIYDFGTATKKYGNSPYKAITKLSDNQIIAVPQVYPYIIDYNPLTKKVFKLGYINPTGTEAFVRSDLIIENKRLIIPNDYYTSLIDITLR
jgi:hypothetical protein